MKIVELQDVPRKPMESPDVKGITKQVPVGVADGSPTMSMRVLTVEPGGFSPYHSHPWEHLNYILAGCGVMVNEAGDEHPISAGNFAFVKPDEKHQFRNTGAEPLQFICLVPTERE
ncbi:MAG: cupin domain-containing protein [Spirochaeta sp.]|jgi:quercetin dioxygenase-like cupin family protein|nr:cupin domain-containing protein [Spirochaeta sp.]